MMVFQGRISWGFKEKYDRVSRKNMMGFQGRIWWVSGGYRGFQWKYGGFQGDIVGFNGVGVSRGNKVGFQVRIGWGFKA